MSAVHGQTNPSVIQSLSKTRTFCVICYWNVRIFHCIQAVYAMYKGCIIAVYWLYTVHDYTHILYACTYGVYMFPMVYKFRQYLFAKFICLTQRYDNMAWSGIEYHITPGGIPCSGISGRISPPPPENSKNRLISNCIIQFLSPRKFKKNGLFSALTPIGILFWTTRNKVKNSKNVHTCILGMERSTVVYIYNIYIQQYDFSNTLYIHV